MSFNSITKKRGFGLNESFWNHFGVVFIEAPIEVVSSTLSNYFSSDYLDFVSAECEINLTKESLFELITKQHHKQRFIWQYIGHSWTIWWAFADENIAFTLAFLLNTKTIVINNRGITNLGINEWGTEVKIFQNDLFIEHYCFGFDDRDRDRDPDPRCGYLSCLENYYWDVNTVQSIYYAKKKLPTKYRHLFYSSVCHLTELEVQNILKVRNDEFGLLDRTLKVYNLYFPNYSEIPLPRYHSVEDFNSLDFEIIRIDSIILPLECFYRRDLLSVPKRVQKNK
jgi:hypothetical protein